MSAPSSCQNCPYLSQSLLGTCQLSEINLISGSKISQRYQRGQVIFQEGHRPAGLYCIHKGKVKVSRVSSDGKEQITSLAREGDVIGYQALSVYGNHASTAVAMSDCIICLVPRPDFFSLIEQNAQFSHALTRLLAVALGEAEQRLLHTAYKPVRERLVEALLLLHSFFRPDVSSNLSISIPRDDLAALMSTAKETASRLLSEFRDEGLIATKGSRITILNLEKLRKLSGSRG